MLGKKHLLPQQAGYARRRSSTKKIRKPEQKTQEKANELHILKVVLHIQEVIYSMKFSSIPEIVYGRIIQEKWRQ